MITIKLSTREHEMVKAMLRDHLDVLLSIGFKGKDINHIKECDPGLIESISLIRKLTDEF